MVFHVLVVCLWIWYLLLSFESWPFWKMMTIVAVSGGRVPCFVLAMVEKILCIHC